MRTYLDCIPCFFKQALSAARLSTDDERVIRGLLDDIGRTLEDIPLESTPPQTGMLIYGKVREHTGTADPFEQIKRESTEKALSLYPGLREKVAASSDPLLTAVRLAIAGNVIDLGVQKPFDIEREVEAVLEKEFAIFDYDEFRAALEGAPEVLYLGDNAGESVFDRILIEELGRPVTFVVRGGPVINDVTHEDALHAGLDKGASIVSSGTSAPGTVLDTCTPEFLELFDAADMIISKGQGNYEALSESDRPIFFLLKAKCAVIADDIGVLEDDIVLKAAGAN